MDLGKALAPLRIRVANMLARASLRLVDDAPGIQRLQIGVLADETRDGVERFQQYGFTSVPLAGAEAVALFVGGRRDHGIVVAVDDRRHRVRGLEQGEVALYHHAGPVLLLKSARLVATAPELRLGSDGATDFVALSSRVLVELNAIRTAFDAHVHGGVSSGSGTTSSPATPLGPASSVAAGKVKAE